VIAFATDVEFPRDPCYRQGLALATTKNKEKLKNFVVRVQQTSSPGANFSNAFTEAFRLLGSTDNSGNDTDWTVANNKRGINQTIRASAIVQNAMKQTPISINKVT